jgi:SOCS box
LLLSLYFTADPGFTYHLAGKVQNMVKKFGQLLENSKSELVQFRESAFVSVVSSTKYCDKKFRALYLRVGSKIFKKQYGGTTIQVDMRNPETGSIVSSISLSDDSYKTAFYLCTYFDQIPTELKESKIRSVVIRENDDSNSDSSNDTSCSYKTADRVTNSNYSSSQGRSSRPSLGSSIVTAEVVTNAGVYRQDVELMIDTIFNTEIRFFNADGFADWRGFLRFFHFPAAISEVVRLNDTQNIRMLLQFVDYVFQDSANRNEMLKEVIMRINTPFALKIFCEIFDESLLKRYNTTTGLLCDCVIKDNMSCFLYLLNHPKLSPFVCKPYFGLSFSLVCLSILHAVPGTQEYFKIIMDHLTKQRVRDAVFNCRVMNYYKQMLKSPRNNFEIVSCSSFKCNPLFTALLDSAALASPLDFLSEREKRKREEPTRRTMFIKLLCMGFSFQRPWCFTEHPDLAKLIVYKSVRGNLRRRENMTNYMNRYLTLCSPGSQRPTITNTLTFAVLNIENELVLAEIIDIMFFQGADNDVMKSPNYVVPCCYKNRISKGKQFPLLNALMCRMFYYESTLFRKASLSKSILNRVLKIVNLSHRSSSSIYFNPDVFVTATYTGCLEVLQTAFKQVTFLFSHLAADWAQMYRKSLIGNVERNNRTYVHLRLAIALAVELLMEYLVADSHHYTIATKLYYLTQRKLLFNQSTNRYEDILDREETMATVKWKGIFREFKTRLTEVVPLKMLCRQTIRTAVSKCKMGVMFEPLISQLPEYKRKYDENGNNECIYVHSLPYVLQEYLLYSGTLCIDPGHTKITDSMVSLAGWLINNSLDTGT